MISETPFRADEPKAEVNESILVETLRGMLNFLNPEKIVPLLSYSYEYIMKDFEWKNSKELYLRYMVHAACMVERAVIGETLIHKQMESLKIEFPKEFQKIKEAFSDLEQMMHIAIADTEIAYLVEMITDTNE